MDEGIDSGRILASADFRLKKEDNIKSVHGKANRLFPKILEKAIQMVILHGRRAGRPQKSTSAIYWHQRQDEDGEIKFQQMTSQEVVRKVRALTHPYPGAWALLKGKKIRVYEAQLPVYSHCGTPGRAFYTKNKNILVGCKDSAVLLGKIKPLATKTGVFYFDK